MNGTWLLLAVGLVLLPRPTTRRAPPRRTTTRTRPTIRLNIVAGAAVTLGLFVVVPWPWGLLSGVLAGAAAHRWIPEQYSRDTASRELVIARTLPDAVDLVAALVRTGLPDATALELAARALPPPLGPTLTRVSRMRALGATPERAWQEANGIPQLHEIAAVLRRQSETGAPVAAVLDRIAADARRDFFSKAQAAARATSVRSVVPLGVCFLPAFFLLCVVPIVAGMVGELSW